MGSKRHTKCIANFNHVTNFTCPFTDEKLTCLQIMQVKEGKKRVYRYMGTTIVMSDKGWHIEQRPEVTELDPVWVEGYNPARKQWDEIISFRTVQHAIEWVHGLDLYVSQ